MTEETDPLDDGTLEQMLSRYREKIEFDDTERISHPVDCYPDSCSLTGYLDDGELKYQEQTGKYPVVDPDTPDWNPRGCSRQCSYTDATYGDERIRQPMRQTGERGSDDWEAISWDEAYTEIADALIDAVEDHPQSVVMDQPPVQGGFIHGAVPFNQLVVQLGGVNFDMDALVGDTYMGQNMTFGKFHHCSTHDDWFKSDLVLIWHSNPAYTRNPSYHFLTEAKYNGTEVVTVAPDYSPSAVHADRYVPVEPASDAALALGMARVVIEEDLVDREFVVEQTDLPLLVREDTDRLLRESDLEDGGSDERFYLWDAGDGLTQAPRETLELGDIQPELEGEFTAEVDGEDVGLRTVYDRMLDRLDEYDLESVEEVTGVHPDVVRELAVKVAENDASILDGFNICKVFHGDLIERAMAFLLAVTGNWGREGTGMRGWTAYGEVSVDPVQNDPVIEGAVRHHADRELTDEELDRKMRHNMIRLNAGVLVPPAFFWYSHCGYDDVWDSVSLDDVGYPRQTSEYVEEALDRGWWDGIALPHRDVDPNVFFLVGSNVLRRTRGGRRVLLDELWPKLDTIVTVDYRWSTTALYSDIVLPAAFHHEKEQFDSMISGSMQFLSYSGKAIEPRHESKTELQMVEELVEKIEERAEERGLEEYTVPDGLCAERFNDFLDLAETGIGEIPEIPSSMKEQFGTTRTYGGLAERLVEDQQVGQSLTVPGMGEGKAPDIMETMIEKSKDSGLLSEDASLERFREQGFDEFTGVGDTVYGLNQGTEIEPEDTVTVFTQHVEDKKPYPSLTGRAQFYIDHEWFLEADEHLPRHKDPPAAYGGDRTEYPYFVTSGHNRHSTHGCTMANDVQMNQHRGEPHVFVSREAAEEKGIEDGDPVRVYNDFDEFVASAKVSSQPADDQVVIYHAWDTYLFEDGSGHHELTPGLVKPIHFAADYGHFEYHAMNWQPQMFDRHVSVGLEPVEEDEVGLEGGG